MRNAVDHLRGLDPRTPVTAWTKSENKNYKKTQRGRDCPQSALDMDRVFPVDFILAERSRKNKTEFLLRWTNYTPRFDSWSSEVSDDLLQSWRKRRRVRKWSKMLPAESIRKVRGCGTSKEFLVKFEGSNRLEWTSFVNSELLRDFEQKRKKSTRKKKL
tara:strand:- start:6284 stop:6760 length:477 start_codon:yes stop_codon:yes gene_type:complete